MVIALWYLQCISFICMCVISISLLQACKIEEKQLLDDLLAYHDKTNDYKLAGSLDYKPMYGMYAL